MHYDIGIINNYDILPNGMLRVFGTIAKEGFLEYQNSDGTIRKEYVPEDVLFSEEHLNSIGGVPLTLGHPPEPVTPANYKKYTVGSTGTQIIKRPDLKTVEIVTVICDQTAIDAVLNGTNQLSMGYDCETVLNGDGTYTQIKRICNHNAIVSKARAEGAKLHIDGWCQVDSLEIKQPEPAFKIISVTI